MTANLDAAKAILEADATLLVIATGGIYSWDETGRMGINRTNAATSAAFSSGIIQPCVLLKLSSSVPFGDIADDSLHLTGARDMLEVWAYQDNGYATIKSMLDRAFTLLQGQRLGGAACRWQMKVQPSIRDKDMDANVEYDRYAVFYIKS